MLKIEDRTHQPNMNEIMDLTHNDTFSHLHESIMEKYNPRTLIEFSGDKNLFGWNLKYKKYSKTLCTIYPRDGYFSLLLVVGRKEKPFVEERLPLLSAEFNQVYIKTKEGMGQKWMLFTIHDENMLLADILEVVNIRVKVK